jgi:hypothetical protein
MNTPRSIKLVLPGDIRKLHSIPSSYDSLLSLISELFPNKNYSLTYSSAVSILSTSDLHKAYSYGSKMPSLKIYLSQKKSKKSCSVCKKPLEDEAFQCLECNILICRSCEMKQKHPHLLLKGNEVDNLKGHSLLGLDPQKLIKELLKYEKKLLKFKVLSHLLPKDFNTQGATNLEIGWVVENTGQIDWPEGSALLWRSGSLKSAHQVIQPLKIGESQEIKFSIITPSDAEIHSGTWEIVVLGISLGKLKTKLTVVHIMH